MRWFVYLLEDTACMLQYIGSTTDVCSRWSSTKSACNKEDSVCTGMYKHFKEGCPRDTGREKNHLRLPQNSPSIPSAIHQGFACTPFQHKKQYRSSVKFKMKKPSLLRLLHHCVTILPICIPYL